MKRVIILSPYKGDIEANIEYGWKCILDSMQRREAPFASHLFYPNILSDSDPAQRSLGFGCEEAWLEVADLAAVYVDRGLSSGMMKTINMLSIHPVIRVPIEMRSIRESD